MIGADVAAAAVLISMGALLGRTTPIQLLLIGLVEIAIFACNEHLQLEMLKVLSLPLLYIYIYMIHMTVFSTCMCQYETIQIEIRMHTV